jgi:hypothetical protein
MVILLDGLVQKVQADESQAQDTCVDGNDRK